MSKATRHQINLVLVTDATGPDVLQAVEDLSGIIGELVKVALRVPTHTCEIDGTCIYVDADDSHITGDDQ